MAIGLAAGIVAGAVAFGAQSDDDTKPHTALDGPPPPAFNRWISPATGRFTVPRWDDRHISEEQKLAKPAPPDPRWAPFAQCMVVQGFAVPQGPDGSFGQVQLDGLLSSINAARPDDAANKAVGAGPLPGVAGAFLTCADTWLAIPVKDFDKHGLVVAPFD
ncbi:MAG: hypothetical protein ACR2HN_04770 [Tepidiformaceae bacterium]